MTPDSNPDNPQHPSNPHPPKKNRLPAKASLSEKGNIEFDFDSKPKAGRFEKFAIPTDPEMIHDLQSTLADEVEENSRSAGANRLSFASQEKTFYRPEPATEKTSTHSKPMPTLSPPPTINDFRKNADRQRREQKSVTNLFSGIAYALIGGILLVAILAGFGGYILWRQIQNQAVTVAQVNSKLDAQVNALKAEQEQFKKFAADQSAFDLEVKEKLVKISAATDRVSMGLRDERDARARDVAALQKRLNRLEGRKAGPGE